MAQAPKRLPVFAGHRVQACGEANESFFCDRGQEFILVAEMAERGSVGDSDPTRYFPERELVRSLLTHQIQRGAKQSNAKITMVVRLADRHVMIMAKNVDSGNWDVADSNIPPPGRLPEK